MEKNKHLHIKLRFPFFILSLLVSLAVSAQLTRVKGKVTDAETGEDVPFANVIFKGTQIGTISGADGSFQIQTSDNVTHIEVSFIGYETKQMPVEMGESQTVDVVLSPEASTLGDVVLVGDKEAENPAHAMMRKIWANKDRNNLENIYAYEYEKYEKIEFDLNNIDKKFTERKLFKPFDFIFDNLDTSDINGKAFLPIFLVESVYDYYSRQDPDAEKEILKGSKAAGFNDNQSVDEFLKSLYQKVNIYDNYIELFDKGFVSPLSTRGLLSYEYFLMDSAFIDGYWCYNMQFIPKRRKELNFKGDFWVNDSTWAIKSIKMQAVGDANINFVNDIAIQQEFLKIDTLWVIKRDFIVVDFSVADTKSSKGVYGKKTTSYRNIKVNNPYPESFYEREEDFFTDRSPEFNRDTAFWKQSRHEELTSSEQQVYTMVDTLKKVPAFRTYLDVVALILSGYWEMDGYDIGPILSSVSFNNVEGLRLRFGGRTYGGYNDRFRLNTYIAYGLKDERFKYSLGAKYLLSYKPRISIGGRYKYDVQQLAQLRTAGLALSTGNFLSSALARNPITQLSYVGEASAYVDYEPFKNFILDLTVKNRTISPAGTFSFDYYSDPEGINDLSTVPRENLITSEVSVGLNYSPGKRYLGYGVERNPISAMYPDLDVNFSVGLDDVFGSNVDFQKVYVRFRHPLLVNPLGKFIYVIEAGKTFGTVPLPLLDIQAGNETYSYSQNAYNMMNFFEFVSDQFIGVQAEHHFYGLFFNKVPLLKKLNLREVISGKFVIGSLSDANKALTVDRDLRAPTRGYYEVGGGIENIFKFIRVEGVWRLSYLDNPDIEKFGVRVVFEIRF